MIILLMGLRILFLCAHDPMIGLANNYDMIRVQGCVDIYPIRNDGSNPWDNSWQAPIERYEFRNDLDVGCYLTSEAIFAFAAWPMMKLESKYSKDGGFSIQWIGFMKALFLLGSMIVLVFFLLRQNRFKSAVILSLLGLVLFADPIVTVYLNTMYAEYSAFAFCCVSLGLIFIVLKHQDMGWLGFLLLFSFLMLLALSKIQHIAIVVLMALALVFCALLAKVRIKKQLIGLFVLASCVSVGVQWQHINGSKTTAMKHANLTNTVLGAFLGSSSDPYLTSKQLGLPEKCAAHAGENWFTEGLQANHPCPEALALSRLTIVSLAWRDSQAFFNVFWKGMEQTRPWIHPFFGKVEGGVSLPLPKSQISWNSLGEAMPLWLYRTVFLVTPMLGLFIVWAIRKRKQALPSAFLMLFLSWFPLASLLTIILGDGLADVAKQQHLGTLSLLTFWLVVLTHASQMLFEKIRGKTTQGFLFRGKRG